MFAVCSTASTGQHVSIVQVFLHGAILGVTENLKNPKEQIDMKTNERGGQRCGTEAVSDLVI